MQPNELLVAPGYDTFSADQLLPGQSEQEGIHACPHTMMASTSPAGGVFGILPAYLAELVRVHLRAGMTWDLTTAPTCRGGRRGPVVWPVKYYAGGAGTSESTGVMTRLSEAVLRRNLSRNFMADVICNGSDPLIQPSAHVT